MTRETGAEQGTVRNFFPAYRVFVAGVEITSLVSSVRTQWPTDSPMQCTIELANPDELMTISERDMLTIARFRAGDTARVLDLQRWKNYGAQPTLSQDEADLLTEFGPTVLPDRIKENNLKLSVQQQFAEALSAEQAAQLMEAAQDSFSPIAAIGPVTPALAFLKKTIVLKKIAEAVYTQSTLGVDGIPRGSETFYKYPFAQGQWIWHPQDPVRVAFRHPSNPSIWYWMHAGSVTDVDENETEDNQSTITLTSEGVLKDLRNARLANMTGAFLSPKTFQGPNGNETTFGSDQYSVIENAVSASSFSNLLQNMTLFQIVEMMIFGVQSILDDFGQAVREGQDPAVIAERFGVPVDKKTSTITAEAIKARQTQIRGLNITGLSKFKRWRTNQGTQVRILGGPIDAGDLAIGQGVQGLHEWQFTLDNQITAVDLQEMYYQPPRSPAGPTASSGGKGTPPSVESAAIPPFPVTTPLGGQGAVGVRNLDSVGGLAAINLPIEDVIEQIGTDPENYPIRQRVLMLLPANLGSNLKRRVVELDLSGCPASQAEFFDRLSLLRQVLERLDFSLMDTPRGDVVVEMPLYDFEPRHFTQFGADDLLLEQLTSSRTRTQQLENYATHLPSGFKTEPEDVYDSENDVIRQGIRVSYDTQQLGPPPNKVPSYDSVFTVFAFEQCGVKIHFSEQEVKTAWISVPRFTDANFKGDGGAQGKRRVQTVLPNLVPLFGFRVEQGDPNGTISSDEGCRVYNNIQLNKANADAVNFRLPMLPNWQAWPNRPFFVERRCIVATSKNVAQTIVWQSECSTDVGFWHAKFWDGRYYDEDSSSSGKRKLFTPFGGVNAQPYNYADLLKIDSLAKKLERKTAVQQVSAFTNPANQTIKGGDQ